MSILDRLVDITETDHADTDETTTVRHDHPGHGEHDERDEREEPRAHAERDEDLADAAGRTERAAIGGPLGAVPVRGMRIQRVRLRSVAKIAAVFFTLGYITVVGTIVVVWNAALALGFVDSLEETVTTALGLDDRFTLIGSDLFQLVLVGVALVMFFGLVVTILMAVVFNVTCSLFGGLAVETGPLRRRHRVFSWRHRGFVTIRQ